MLVEIPHGKIAVCLIACIHLVILFNGTVPRKNAGYEELKYIEEITNSFTQDLHFILIFSLVYSAVENKPNFLLPWLLVSFPVFVCVTFAIFDAQSKVTFHKVFNGLIDLFFTTLFWLCWSIVYLIYRREDFENPFF